MDGSDGHLIISKVVNYIVNYFLKKEFNYSSTYNVRRQSFWNIVSDTLHLRETNICPAQLNSLCTAALLWLQNNYFNKVNLLTHILFLRFN